MGFEGHDWGVGVEGGGEGALGWPVRRRGPELRGLFLPPGPSC